jgi:hypothetical protein
MLGPGSGRHPERLQARGVPGLVLDREVRLVVDVGDDQSAAI